MKSVLVPAAGAARLPGAPRVSPRAGQRGQLGRRRLHDPQDERLVAVRAVVAAHRDRVEALLAVGDDLRRLVGVAAVRRDAPDRDRADRDVLQRLGRKRIAAVVDRAAAVLDRDRADGDRADRVGLQRRRVGLPDDEVEVRALCDVAEVHGRAGSAHGGDGQAEHLDVSALGDVADDQAVRLDRLRARHGVVALPVLRHEHRRLRVRRRASSRPSSPRPSPPRHPASALRARRS